MKLDRYVWTPLALMVAVGLLWKTQEVAAGVKAGLLCSANVVIPSLFPFMILAGLLCNSKVGQILSRAVSGFTHGVLGVPEQLGSVFLMSFIGGYPVGARMLSELTQRRQIDEETASRALCFCVNAGPSFLISGVGAGMLGSRTAGLILLGAQILSSLFLAAMEFGGARSRKQALALSPAQDAGAGGFVAAVQSASAGVLGICSFVVAFSALTALLNALGVLAWLAGICAQLFPLMSAGFFIAAFTGILEVVGGCVVAANLHNFQGFILCAFVVSFSSFSIIFQIKSCFPSHLDIRFGRFYRSRLIHGILTALMASLAYRWIPPADLAAGAMLVSPLPRSSPNVWLSCLCVMGMCSILLLPRRKTPQLFGKF